jgi:UBA-like domain
MQKVEQLDEDSSYDSDTEIVSSPHQNVSRNVSETLAQELLEDFNSVSISFFHSVIIIQYRISSKILKLLLFLRLFFSSLLAHSASRSYAQTSYRQYQTYLEFALKLGYSERLVQSALNRLGNPTNNELLAELIKLGAQPGSNGKVFDGNAVHFELVFFFFLLFSSSGHLFIIFLCFTRLEAFLYSCVVYFFFSLLR